VISLIEPRIAENLKQYAKHEDCICLECGYEGLMGVGKPTLPAYLRIPLKISLFIIILIAYGLTGKSIWALLALSAITAPLWIKLDKHYLFCPNCQLMVKKR
jgi:hypothetical protein